MKACGVIAEYNPFHNGHRYQLAEAKKMTNSDVMVVAMSGNFVQRGAPSLLDKWARAEIALHNGADVVVEMPILGSVQAADLFAKTGVKLLQALQCDAFAFGAEEGIAADFIERNRILKEHEAEINQVFQSYRNDGRTYAAQLESAIAEVLRSKDSAISFSTPNNQLGLAYVRENEQYRNPMETAVVIRKGASHHASVAAVNEYASGTAIREWVLASGSADKWELLSKWVPAESLRALEQQPAIDWDQYWQMLQYQLTVQSVSELAEIYQVEEGIEYRLKKMAEAAPDFLSFMEHTKTKRWTWARLQRVCTYILLGITKEEAEQFQKQLGVVRLLGFTEKGRAYLHAIKKDAALPILTKVHQKDFGLLEIEVRSDRIYRLGSLSKLKEQNFSRSPIYLKDPACFIESRKV
ncbi:high nucleotidyl transferase [Trichococcus palustris]|uniref:tRNA(Met) cytidine acetate ligase n=1 Tax=Trichococcus palustris TaxID=140314 RepID=A0A143YQL9_9LACT|nr:nucleotidyltransferase [Trichococcus palustris]CZQ94647.1 high nucleotidyl transferase [Trichococcus palustris]SFK91689.1 Predicted nucleotidyltransferase [Trichococcus palustris]